MMQALQIVAGSWPMAVIIVGVAVVAATYLTVRRGMTNEIVRNANRAVVVRGRRDDE